MKKFFIWSTGILLALMIVGAFVIAKHFGIIMVDFDDVPPVLPTELPRPAVLVFSKAVGYVHVDALPAGKKLLSEIADSNGWSLFETENGAVMSAEILERFDLGGLEQYQWHHAQRGTECSFSDMVRKWRRVCRYSCRRRGLYLQMGLVCR